MWRKSSFFLLVCGITLWPVAMGRAVPQQGKWGTWNADLTCGGYPEVECARPPYYASAPEVNGRPDVRTVECRPLLSPGIYPARLAALRPARLMETRTDGSGIAVRIEPDLDSAWFTSGAWQKDGSLLLVDAGRQQVLRLDRSGERLVPLDLPYPTREIRASAEGFLLKTGSVEFLVLDQDLKPKRRLSLSSTDVRGISNWTTAGNTVLAFADMEKSPWTSGWIRVPLEAPENYQLLREAAIEGLDRNLYTLGMPYLTSTGKTSYFLAEANGGSSIFQVEPAAALPRRLTEELPLKLPAFPAGARPDAVVKRYGALEKSALPAGLYAHQGNLYLLTRRPGAEGTQWRLHGVNPDTGALLGSLELPTKAPHLLVVPGEERWAIIEKGAVLAPGQQEVFSIILLPSAWIDRSSLT